MITILTRNDLIFEAKNIPLEEITRNHIKTTKQIYEMSSVVFFVDGNEAVKLKDIHSAMLNNTTYHLSAVNRMIRNELIKSY